MNTSLTFPVNAVLLVGPTGSGKSPLGDVLVLNGIPRHEGRANDVASIATVHAVMVLNFSIESVMQGIEENTGGTGRVDDDQTLTEKKLRIFEERAAPFIEHYR
jgi:energy-coupling factor transporter ATP-binding protein EcfA2